MMKNPLLPTLPERRQHGFTLVEVMVALMVVALTVPALLFTLDQQVDGTAHIRDRSLAQIVAANRLAELRLAMQAGSVQGLSGELGGSEEMLGRTWYWRVRTSTTEMPDFSRIELQVRLVEDDKRPSLHTLVAYAATAAQES